MNSFIIVSQGPNKPLHGDLFYAALRIQIGLSGALGQGAIHL